MTYGNGLNNFARPDLDGSLAVDTGSIAGLPSFDLGRFDGTENNTLTIAQMPAHDHTLPVPEPAPLAALVPAFLVFRRPRKNK